MTSEITRQRDETTRPRDHRFLMGLLAGTVAGAGLAVWMAPKAGSELRRRLHASVRGLSALATDRYDQASDRVVDLVDHVTVTGQGVRNGVADAVAQGARDVARRAIAMKSDGR